MESVRGTGVVLFNVSKKEVAHPKSGFKKLLKKLKASLKCAINQDEITLRKLQEASLVIFGGPQEPFTASEIDAIKAYIQDGGSVLVFMGEGGESKSRTNINYLLEDFGMEVNSDAVVRTVYYKYLHPKESYITNGILNKEITRVAKGLPKQNKMAAPQIASSLIKGVLAERNEFGSKKDDNSGLNFVYPYGATLTIQSPAIPLLSTGPVSYPINRPVAGAFNTDENGRLMVIASHKIFDDEYIDKEDNAKLQDSLFKWLLTDESDIMTIAREDPDLGENHKVPDIASLSEKLRGCMQKSDEIPRDFKQMFAHNLFKFDTDLIPEAVEIYEELKVKHEILTLIPPQFEVPILQLRAAVFPPYLKESQGPALDLFDLDEAFADEKTRLAQLANKFDDDNLDFFVKECADILGVSKEIEAKKDAMKATSDEHEAKMILEYVFTEIVNYKKFNREA